MHADIPPASPYESILQRDEHSAYRSLVGELLYLSVSTRPYLSFALGVLSRQLRAPIKRHFTLLKSVLQYLRGTFQYGLIFRKDTSITASSLSAAVDAD